MDSFKSMLAIGLVAIATVGCAPKEEPATSTAPKTTAAASSGPTLEQVSSKAPAVLYFVKKDCGSNPSAIPLVQRVYEANAKAGKFYVVMNADQSTADAWAEEYKTTFPIIADPDKKIIGRYGIKNSQTAILVDSDLKETKKFAGYGLESLQAMNASLAGSGAPAKVDLAEAPSFGVG
jgi:peroxiredoxin